MKLFKIRVVLIFSIFLAVLNPGNVVSQTKSNKFREREASDDSLGYENLDENELLNSQCPQNLELRWQSEVSSSIYATPLIADINSDGKLDIVVPSFVHYLEVLEGSDGDKMPGWPAYHQSHVHASPLLYDIDKDGIREIALATYNGEVLFFRASGYMMSDKLVIPRRRIKKDWHVGLQKDPTDRSHPDVHDDLLVQDAAEADIMSHLNGKKNAEHESVSSQNDESGTKTKSSIPEEKEKNQGDNLSLSRDKEEKHDTRSSGPDEKSTNKYSGLEASMKLSEAKDNVSTGSDEKKTNIDNDIEATMKLSPAKDNVSLEAKPVPSTVDASRTELDTSKNQSQVEHTDIKIANSPENMSANAGPEHVVNVENRANFRRRLLEDNDTKGDGAEELKATTVENEQGLEADADTSFDLFRDNDELADEYNYDYDDYVDETMWDDEEWSEAHHEREEDYVHVDSHILCTPVIADIDDDGISEMIVAVSYFFDREYYDNPEHAKDLGGLDIGKYVAGSIVVFNLETKQVKWTQELDLSTEAGKFRAYIYSSPTVVDLDGDGKLDILVGTSYGLFYVLDHRGQVRNKFPLAMAEIQGAVIAADINDDGKIELVTTDAHGNVAAWTAQGKEIWERHVKSLIPQGPSIGDVDGDGHTDVVVPTISGNIYVLSGKDGSMVRPYPYRTHGRVMNQVLLVDLSRRGQKKQGLTIVTTSFDGYLYLIDGPTSCADVVDIGETSYSMVLADNVDGGDDLDLIVTTMNGNVFCFSTPSPHHPLKAWRSSSQGMNNVASRYNREGVFISPSSRNFRDEEGKNFWIEINIVDQHRYPSGFQAPYNVTTSLLVPGNYQGERTIKQNQLFHAPGRYRIKLPTVNVRTTGTVLVEMVDRNRLYFSDEFSLSFHVYYYKLLKWLVVLPMIGMFGILVILRPQEPVPLPSFSRNID